MRKPRITLLLLIVALGVLTAMIAFVNALAAAQIVQKEQLIARSLEANRAYAAKLAATVDLYIGSVQRQLEVSASRLPALLSSPQALAAEAARVARQSDGVVAAFVADRDNRVIAFESLAPELTQKPAMLSRVEIDQREVAGHVSAVYLSADGFPIVLFSQPIRDAEGSYLGLLGAVIFLQQDNELDRLVSVHFHHDGSNVYVVDSGGKVLVHQDKSLIGTNESGNVVVDALGRGEAGAVAVTGTRGKRYFAGYAPMRSGKWGVVVQTPEAVTLEPQRDLLRRLHRVALPPQDGLAELSSDARVAVFAHFLAFLRRNLNGQTSLPTPPIWASQTEVLSGFARLAVPDMLVREDRLPEDLAHLARAAGIANPVLDGMTAPIPDVLRDRRLAEAAQAAYLRDYVTFGFDLMP